YQLYYTHIYAHRSSTFYHFAHFFLLLLPPPPISTLFPYTTLFRSIWWAHDQLNVVVTDWKGLVTGTVKDGVEYNSKDGISYQLVDRKSTRLNSSHVAISYAVFCLKKKNNNDIKIKTYFNKTLYTYH